MSKRATKPSEELEHLVRGRSSVQQNQTGSGFHGDKRTKRGRDRSTRERQAIEENRE